MKPLWGAPGETEAWLALSVKSITNGRRTVAWFDLIPIRDDRHGVLRERPRNRVAWHKVQTLDCKREKEGMVG